MPPSAGGFGNAGELRGVFAASLRRRPRIAVSHWAERYRRLHKVGGYNGPWRNASVPHLVEIMDRFQDEAIEVVVQTGPSQWGKTEVYLNVIGHAAKHEPGDIRVLQPGKDDALDFVETRVDELIKRTPALLDELGPARSDDTQFVKVFRSGMRVYAFWPTAKNLSRWNARKVLVDERDRIKNDVEGEGDPVTLCRNRIKVFGRKGKVGVAGSPAGDLSSPTLRLYGESDGNLWHWPCASCGEYWTPGFDEDRRPTLRHFTFSAEGTPEEAAASARLVCPCCGACDLGEREKFAMHARGVWLPRGVTISAAGKIEGQRPATKVAGYWFCGLASPFESLATIASKLVAAERAFVNEGDETDLKAVWNTVLGFPYVSRKTGKAPLDAADLERRREADFAIRTVPPGVRFLTAAVDVGGDRFDVLVQGWGEGNESWMIDRFAIRQLPDGATDLRPAQYPEHWLEIIRRVVFARYPIAGRPGWALPVSMTAVDTGGLDGVTPNARALWRQGRALGLARDALMLVKGASEARAPIIKPPTVESEATGKAKQAEEPIYILGVSRLKDIVDNRLRRAEPGPTFVHFPAGFEARYFLELVAERKIDGVWTRRGANETLDLAVYNAACAFRIKPDLHDWTSPPSWAAPIFLDPNAAPAVIPPPAPAAAAAPNPTAATPASAATEAAGVAAPAAVPPPRARAAEDWIPTRDDWLN